MSLVGNQPRPGFPSSGAAPMSQPSQGAAAQQQSTSQGANSVAPAVGQQTPTPAPTAPGADSASSATPG